jgi:hypothetical protein
MNSLRIAIHKLTLYQGAASKLRKNRNCAGFVSGHDFTGCGKTRRSCLNGPLCIRARLYRLRKNSQNVFQEGALYQGTTLQAAEKLVDRVSMGRFVSGHDFTGCGKTRRSCLNGPLCIRARLQSCRKRNKTAAGFSP